MMNLDKLNDLTEALEAFAERMTPPPEYVATYTEVEQAPLALAMSILFEEAKPEEADESAE